MFGGFLRGFDFDIRVGLILYLDLEKSGRDLKKFDPKV